MRIFALLALGALGLAWSLRIGQVEPQTVLEALRRAAVERPGQWDHAIDYGRLTRERDGWRLTLFVGGDVRFLPARHLLLASRAGALTGQVIEIHGPRGHGRLLDEPATRAWLSGHALDVAPLEQALARAWPPRTAAR